MHVGSKIPLTVLQSLVSVLVVCQCEFLVCQYQTVLGSRQSYKHLALG